MRHMPGSRKFCQKGSNSGNVVVDEGERIQIPQKAGPYRTASKTPFIWRFAGVQMMAYR